MEFFAEALGATADAYFGLIDPRQCSVDGKDLSEDVKK